MAALEKPSEPRRGSLQFVHRMCVCVPGRKNPNIFLVSEELFDSFDKGGKEENVGRSVPMLILSRF